MTAEPFGDGALRLLLPEGAEPRAVFEVLRAIEGAVDVVVAERHACLTFDPRFPVDAVLAAGALQRARWAPSPAPRPPVLVRVRYDGPDLARVAAWAGLSPEEVARLHAGRDYTVRMLGFLPGFAYLGDVDPRIAAPRLPSPRPRVPALAVGIAGARTGIYPFASPGGWNLIGTAVGFAPFDPGRGAALALGDTVRFVPGQLAGEAPPLATPPQVRSVVREGLALEAVRVAGPALVVDGGRPGLMHQGVPPGGPLVPELLAATNRAVHNSPGAAALEIYGALTLRARGAGLIALDGASHMVSDGETIQVGRPNRVAARYLAIRGGLDVPRVLGGRGVLLSAGLGGLGGRPLCAGDLLCAGAKPANVSELDPPALDLEGPVPVVPGPDLDRFPPGTLELLVSATFTVSPASDRTGMRLVGPPLPRLGEDSGVSAPMVRGAIQVTAGGEAIVLGPDHPTTGGYPVLATVPSAGWGSLAARRPGAAVRFRPVLAEQAREALARRAAKE